MAVRDRIRVTDSGCHEWTGAVGSHGYGNVNFGGKFWKAHRLAWTEQRGEIPDGLCVLHSCDNTKCCNPDHLFLGTKLDNYADMRAKGRERKAQGERHHHSCLSDESVCRIREAYLYGARQVDLAAAHDTEQSNISAIVRRSAWTHLE